MDHILIAEKAPGQPLRDKLDGRTDAKRRNTVLRVRSGATESTLSEHTLL